MSTPNNEPSKITETEEAVMWTTWEELLLASAVKRHGVKDWEAVSMEIQSRSTTSPPSFLTPTICHDKFIDLQRRFTHDVIPDGNDVTVSVLEHLRKLRMEELRQEVQRYDLSIQSLQIQVKRLEDERERSEPENDENNKNSEEDVERTEPVEVIKKTENEDENRSINESNSSGNRKTGSGLNSIPEPVEVKPVREESCNDSSDRHNSKNEGSIVKVEESGELRGGDSVEDGGTGNTKESSDVQSTASLTKKKKTGRVKDGNNNGGSKGGGDKVVVVNTGEIKRRESCVKSEPLIAFLDVIRSHKFGLVFERRLDSQMTDKYKNMIRQHVDLQLVRTRIDDGSYSTCPKKFYLDLLLLFNNAIVFFPKSSSEFQAACSLRTIVMEELKTTSVKLQPKLELERSDSLLLKHRSTSPIVVVCRKRSSMAAKPSTSATKSEKQADNRPLLNLKPPVKSLSSAPIEDTSLIKLKLNEKPVTGARSARRGSKNRPNSNPTQSNPSSNQNTSSSSQQAGAQKGEDTKPTDKKKSELSNAAKKRGAADFLKRIKKNSPAKGSLVEALRDSDDDDSMGSKTDQVKRKADEKKVAGSMRRGGKGNGGGRRSKGDDSPSKKNVGRPPKKIKDLSPPKHGRDEGEGSSKRPVKRPRR